jgi:hypothetical protein
VFEEKPFGFHRSEFIPVLIFRYRNCSRFFNNILGPQNVHMGSGNLPQDWHLSIDGSFEFGLDTCVDTCTHTRVAE